MESCTRERRIWPKVGLISNDMMIGMGLELYLRETNRSIGMYSCGHDWRAGTRTTVS